MLQKNIDKNLFGIIGLGRFGTALAIQLLNEGKSIIALDNDESHLNVLKDMTSQVYKIGQINKQALEEAGIGSCGTVIVGIGKDLENNLLAALNSIELGVPRVIAKANSDEHARLLKMLGAEVVFPEVDVAERLSRSLSSRFPVEFLSLGDDFSIVKVELTSAFGGKNVQDSGIRKKYLCNIIAIIRSEKVITLIQPETMLQEGDIVVVSGSNSAIAGLQKANSRKSD